MKLKEDAVVMPSSEVMYDVICGGYYDPEKLLDDPDMARQISDAISVVSEYIDFIEENTEEM